MGFISCLFTVLITAGLPLVGALFLFDADRKYLKSFFAGIAIYAILQILSVVPPFNDFKPLFAPYGTVVAVYAPAFIMACVSEIMTFLAFRFYLKNRHSAINGIALGFGHWSAVAVMNVGITALILFLNHSQSADVINPVNMALSGLGELFILPVYVLLSMLCLKAARENKYICLAAAILLNFAVSGTTMFTAVTGIIPPAASIAATGLLAIIFTYVIFRLFTSLSEEDNNKK